MNSIRGILLALLVAALTLFAVANSFFVRVNLGVRQFEIWLPLLLLLMFALGFVPMWLWLVADRARFRRRLAKLEKNLDETETELARARVELLRPPSAGDPAPSAPSSPAPPGN